MAFYPLQDKATGAISASPNGCGRSSGVEHNLAKVRVESSNLFARSNWSKTPAFNVGFFMPHRKRLPPGVMRVTIAPKQIKFTF